VQLRIESTEHIEQLPESSEPVDEQPVSLECSEQLSSSPDNNQQPPCSPVDNSELYQDVDDREDRVLSPGVLSETSEPYENSDDRLATSPSGTVSPDVYGRPGSALYADDDDDDGMIFADDSGAMIPDQMDSDDAVEACLGSECMVTLVNRDGQYLGRTAESVERDCDNPAGVR